MAKLNTEELLRISREARSRRKENQQNEPTQFSTGIEPTKVENPYPTFSEKLSGSMLGTTPKNIASTLPQRKAMQDVEEEQKRAFETKFTTDPEYRANWFQENTGMSEEDFKAASAKVFAERFDNLLPRAENIFKKNIEDNAKQRGGTGVIRTIENLSSSMGVKSKLDELRGLSASFKNNNVWSGMYEGADLLDVMSGGLANFASEKAYHEALKKQANGEELSEEEQFAIDASDLYDDINETFELLGGRSGWNKAGMAVGQSAEFSAGMLPTSGLGFATGLMKNVGLKAGWKAVKDAANNGVRAALTESLKQGGKVIGRSLYNTGLTYAESIPRAVFMPSTYSRYWELRNERLKNGESLEGNWLQDAGRAGIEMTHELASEIWGSTIIHDSFRAMGKALGVDKAMDAIGFGHRKRTIFGWTPTAAQREAMRNLGYSGDWFSEVASEAAGDVATNLAMGVFFDDARWGDMATKEYWTTLLGATAMQGIAFTSANMLTNIPEYHRLNNSQKKRDNALSNIKSEDLRKDVEIALTYDSAEDMGTALSQIDWNAYDKVDVANAMDAVRLEVPLRIATSEREESERIAKFAPLLEATMAQAYQGADAANPAPQPIYVEAKTEDGASVRIVSGDYTNPDAMLNVEDISTGESFPIIASKVSDIKELSLEKKIAESYKLMFSTEENVKRLSKVMESLGRLAYYGKVTSADAEDIIKRAGYAVFSEGQIATLVNGEQVEIASPIMADGHYLVRDNNGNTSIVSLLDIVQPNVEVAEAQIKMASREEQGTTAEATSAMGQSMNASMPQSPMPEGVTAGEVWVTPQGIGRVLEYNPGTGKVYVDINLSSDTLNKEEDEELVEVDAAELTRKPSEAEMAEARARSVRRNALRIVDETSDAVGAIQEVEDVAQPVEQAAEVTEQAPQEVPSMENVPTTADGAVDYEAITDANLYAKLLTQDLGSKEEALEVVNTSIEAYEAEIADMQSKKEKSTTKAVAKNKQIKAMQQQLDVLNQVRDILAPQETMAEVEQIAETPQVEETQQEPLGLVQDDFTATLPKGEAELIDSLARSLGLSVEFVDQVNKGNSNAQILGNKVLIAKKNRDKAIKFLVGHEFTHRMQDLSPEAYAEFKAAVKEYMGEELYNSLLQKEIAKYREHNIYRTQEQLEDEVIADFAGSLALETDALDSFIAAHADKKSMWQAILDVLRAIREWILKDTAYDTAEARALQNTIDKLETLLQSASEKVAEGTTAQNEEKRLSAKDKRKSAITTESAQKEHQPSAVVIADNANILKNIDYTIKKYENLKRPNTLLGDLADALGIDMPNKKSKYRTFEAVNGKVFTIRLSDHNATVKNFDNKKEKEGISIVITPSKNSGIVKGGDAHIWEYFYDSAKLRKADGKPLVEILKSIKQAMYSGEYKDTTGLAEVEEVNPIFSLKELDIDLRDNNISIDNKDILDAYGLSSLTITKRGDYVTLSKIVVDDRGNGNGTRFMNDLASLADENDWTLVLTPDDSFGATSVNRLKDFYKRFGFKENNGRNTDFSTRESMVRRPNIEARNSLKSLDAPYLDAVARGDMATAERLVREAAAIAMPNTKVVDEDGLPKVVYHGTGSEFYTFRNTSDINELGAGYYFSDSYEMAERYATDETLADNRFRVEALAFDIFTDEMGHSEEDYDDIEFEDDYNEAYALAVERLFGNGRVMSVFLNIENPRILSRVSPDFDPTYRYGFIYQNEGAMAKRYNDGVIDEMFTERHNGLTGNQYVVFNPNQIKSADPVTYDDAGNIIPLSERFNPEKEDIRYSVKDIESAERIEAKGGQVDLQRGDVLYSVKDVLTGDDREQAIRDLMAVTGRSRKTVLNYLKAEESLAKIILDGDNVAFLDLQVDESVPSIWNNSDYPQGTVEFSNICRKRLPFTMIYQQLQKEFPNTIFNASTLETIRGILKENGIDVACGLCFVEDRRQLLGEIGQSFIDALKGETEITNENQKRSIEALRDSGDSYIPTLFELLTLEGMKILRKEHPDVARAFIEYNNARGMQAGRLFQAYSAYHREILGYNKAKVDKINNSGGLRIFSFSDFEAHHLIDLIQVLTDCARKGIKVQGYTKVPEFARAVKDTRMKLNRSLIAKDLGVVDADYIPSGGEAVSPNVINGKRLLLDTVEGIDVTHKDFFDSTTSPNVGNILVGINDEQIRQAMADPFIDYIIPFHSGLSEQIRRQKGIGDWVNYKLEQLEKIDTGNGKLKNADKHGINIYTEVLSDDIRTERQFVERYLAVCREKGWVPKFHRFLKTNDKGEFIYTKGYYKFLLDFKMFDKNGKILPQEAVVPIFDNALNARILEEYVADEKVKTPNTEVYEQIKEALLTEGKIRYSLIGEKGVANLDKAEETTIRLDGLAVAREMEESGKNAKAIKMATGWERGVDGLWRFEIPDVRIKDPEEWIDKRSLKIADIVENADEIFTAYPELSNIKIKKTRAKGGGAYVDKDKAIELGIGHIRGWIDGLKNPSKYYSTLAEIQASYKQVVEKLRGTILHEIQHAIQFKEGFAQGGNVDSVRTPEEVQEYDSMVDSYNRMVRSYNSLSSIERMSESGRIARQDLENKRNKIEGWLKRHKIGKEGYRKLAGEVEARNVERRASLTMMERLASLAEETEDVAREDQIILRNGFISESRDTDSASQSNDRTNAIENLADTNPLFHLKDNVDDSPMTPAEIRAHMFENITRHHEREVNRINRLYDAERRKAERISEQQRKQNGEYPRNAKYTVRLQFLMPYGKTAYPLEWQVVHDIANGLKVKWNDSKDGKKRGLSTELGLGSSRREKYGAITTGAQMYVEDYVAQLVEENDGYVRGIDDNDVRSIVLDALSQYTRPKEALDALEQQFLVIEEDAKLQESIDYIERARAKALQEEDEKYEVQKASYEKNPRKFERDYFSRMEKDLRWLNFKEREIRVMREKIQRIRADYRSGREVRNQYLAEVKADIEKFLNNMYGRNISTSEVRFIMNALKKATSVENVTYILNRIATMDYYGTQRIEQERKARLLKMKLSFFIPAENQSLEQYLEQEKISRADAAAFVSRFEEGNVGDDMTVFRAAFKDRYKGVDSKGVTVAKLIDAETAEIMAFISKHAYDKVDLESIESATEKLYEEAERLKDSLPFSQDAMEKIDQAREIIISYWSATAEREELKKSKEDLNDVEARITEAWKNGDYDLMSQLRAEKDAILKDRSSRMPSINSQLIEANDAVERLLLNGKRLLSEEREAQRQHEIEVLNDVVNDITNFGEDYNELMAKANDHRKQTSEERKSKVNMAIHEWTDSLNHLLTLLAPYADGGRGLTYTRFMTAINKAVADTCDNVDIVNAQIAEAVDAIFGKQFQYKNLAQIMRRASAISLAEDVTLGYKAVGKERTPHKWHLRMDNALYLLAMWGQAEGRIKLEANGVTEADIANVEDLIIKKDRRYLEFMNWVIRELLPSRREGRYNEVFRKVTGRWMPYVENYFPIHILSNSRHTEEKVSEAAGDKKSISPSAIKARIYNTNMIDLNVGFFEALMDNLTTMETWASMAEIEKDMNAILSNNRTKDLMNARLGENFSDRLKTAMQVTLGTLTSGKLGVTERWALNASRLWGATKIGYRINTALKQLSGAGALFAYTGNPVFIGYVLKNLAPTDAAEMFPILEKRWKEGLLGNAGLMDLSRGGDLHVKDWLDRSSDVYGDVTSTITKLGMYPNKIVDFYVSAVFAKSVYQFELNRYKKMGYSEEQAKEKALMDAEDSYNKTQQSSEMAYLSSGQINPNIVYRGLNVFMNNSIANYRLGLSGFEDVARAFSRFSKAQRYYRKEAEKRLYEKYIAEGKSEEEAMKMAKEESQDYKGTSRMGYFARGILKTVWGWWGSNFLFNYLSILPYMWFGDDDEKKREMTSDLWWSALFSPIALIPWGKILYDSVVVAYNNYNNRSIASSVLPMLEGVEDLIEDIVDIQRAIREDDDLSNAQIYNTFNTLSTMMVGVDMNTFVSIGDGIADIANGDWMEGTLDILNVPNSQVKLLVGDRKADESWEVYMTRILRVRSLLDKNKVEAAEAAKYNPTTQKWESEPNITEAQKRDITKMYKQYENAYQQNVLKKHRPNMGWSDTEKRYEEVVKEIGWSPNKNPSNKEPKVEISTEVLNTLRYLQGHNAAMNKLKARFVGSDEEYAKYLDTIYQDRKQLIQLYDDNVK